MSGFVQVAAGAVLLVAGAVWFQRRVWFYRDPVRNPRPAPGEILSPADGTVVYVRPFRAGRIEVFKQGEPIEVEEITRGGIWPPGDGWLVGVYMSPLDVHFNYAPVDGRVVAVRHHGAARNWPMVDLWEYVRLTYLRRAVDLYSKRFRLENERNTVFLEGKGGLRLALVEIADRFVNKIRCFVAEGAEVRVGEKISFIERGSQVDLVLFEPAARPLVQVGDRVRGGETPLLVLPRPAGEGTER